jgi:hypothetical protein
LEGVSFLWRRDSTLAGPALLSSMRCTAAVVVVQSGTALPTELPEHEALRAGLEPATCRLGGDNRIRSGPQQVLSNGNVAVVECGRSAGVEPQARKPLMPSEITEPLRPATNIEKQARSRTRTGEVGARRASAYTTGLRGRTTRIERASPEWRSGALPAELRPRSGTPGWTRTSGLCRRRTALSPLSYGRTEEPPAGVEPAPRPYKGRVLAVDTTEAKVETVGVEPTSSSLQARRSSS